MLLRALDSLLRRGANKQPVYLCEFRASAEIRRGRPFRTVVVADSSCVGRVAVTSVTKLKLSAGGEPNVLYRVAISARYIVPPTLSRLADIFKTPRKSEMDSRISRGRLKDLNARLF